jgi:hypothetical protein
MRGQDGQVAEDDITQHLIFASLADPRLVVFEPYQLFVR